MLSSSQFTPTLIAWYEGRKRDLPWRKTSDPYAIWLSEIILQQTRVEQGISYYKRFLESFPNVSSLAAADEGEVLKLWQGLGYYSRARNMHGAARYIVSNLNGHFPTDFQSIRALRGVGDYTAAAIASFAFGLPHYVVDGNVKRLISRLFAIDDAQDLPETKRKVNEKVALLFVPEKAAEFNQAIMEFGALHCKPSKPDCQSCPFATSCKAYSMGKVGTIPLAKRPLAKKDRYFNYAVIRRGKNIIVRKRKEKDIWQNLYDFPLVESLKKSATFEFDKIPGLLMEEDKSYKKVKGEEWKVQLLSHQRIHARFHKFSLDRKIRNLPDGWELTTVDKLKTFPVPKLIESYINGM